MNYLKKLFFYTFVSFIFIGCTSEVSSLKDKAKSQVLNSFKKTSSIEKNKIIKSESIYQIQTRGLFQRGFRVFKKNDTTVALESKGMLSSIFLTNGKTNISVPIKGTLEASINKDIKLVKGILQGFSVYAIAKENGKSLKLKLVAKGSRLSLPKDYQFFSTPLWYILVDKRGDKHRIFNFIDLGDGLNHYYRSRVYNETSKRALIKSVNPREIQGIYRRFPSYARYAILDITIVVKNQKRDGSLKIFLDRGSANLTVGEMLFIKSLEEKVYTKTFIIPILKKVGRRDPSLIKIHVTGLSSTNPSDAYGYFYLNGWKKVNHF